MKKLIALLMALCLLLSAGAALAAQFVLDGIRGAIAS